MRFWNADGEEVEACGNGTRCVGWLLMQASGADEAVIETEAGRLVATRAGDGLVTVDMGEPRPATGARSRWPRRWTPAASSCRSARSTTRLLHTPGCVTMGNPHVVFFVPDVEAAPVARGRAR